MFGHVKQRVDIWLDPSPLNDAVGGSYQLMQGLFGMGTGGILGKGLGQGRPGHRPVREHRLHRRRRRRGAGLTGLMALLLVYAIIAQRGMRTAIGCA